MYMKELPIAEIVSGIFNGSSRLISGIYLRMHHMSIRQRHRNQIVHMCGEAPETALISHEAVDIDKKQRSSAISSGVCGHKRLSGR